MTKEARKPDQRPDFPPDTVFDFFSDVHENKELEIQNDGRSIKFPYGWSQADADKMAARSWPCGHGSVVLFDHPIDAKSPARWSG